MRIEIQIEGSEVSIATSQWDYSTSLFHLGHQPTISKNCEMLTGMTEEAIGCLIRDAVFKACMPDHAHC